MELTSVGSHLTATLPPPPPTSTTTDTNGVIELVATAVIIIVAAIIFVTNFIFRRICRSFFDECCGMSDRQDVDGSHDGDGEILPRRTLGLTRPVIETFPAYMYSVVRVHRLGNGELECAICLNEFRDDETLRLLPICRHAFHLDCIDKWLIYRATCPVCRTDVRTLIVASSDGHHSDDIEQISVQTITTSPETMQITRFQEDHPKSHSTGHSPAWTEPTNDRFTLVLPEEVRDKLSTGGGRWSDGFDE